MSPCPPALLLALLLLGTALPVWAQPSSCQTGIRRIELKEGSAPPAELCISPGLVTTLLFDRELASTVELEGRARFERVDVAGRTLVLLPSGKLAVGERLRLTVRFTSPEAPASATFVLGVHRDEAERQVEVSRAPRGPELCPPSPPKGSLAQLLADRAFGSATPPERALSFPPPVLAPGSALKVSRLKLYRIENRLVVEVFLVNTDPGRPFRLGGAGVTDSTGKGLEPFAVVLLKPVAPRQSGSLWVELEGRAGSFPDTYSLQLWDEDKARTVTLPGLKLR